MVISLLKHPTQLSSEKQQEKSIEWSKLYIGKDCKLLFKKFTQDFLTP